MNQNKFSELIFAEDDIVDLLMQGHDVSILDDMIVDQSVNLEKLPDILSTIPKFKQEQNYDCSITDWHKKNQKNWHMPDEYKNMDIAEHILSLCKSEAELQRCGAELLLYQEKDLFDLLIYLKYLVDVMKTNDIIWGVGRGSSVSSFVLYKLGVHRIDSLYYNLDVREFLR